MLHDPRWQKQLDDILPEPNAAQLILIQAKALIEQYGWVQKRFGTEEAGFCMVGAVQQAVRDSIDDDVDGRAALATLGSPRQMVDWNDAPGRTKQEVLAAFDLAIAAAG